MIWARTNCNINNFCGKAISKAYWTTHQKGSKKSDGEIWLLNVFYKQNWLLLHF